MNGFYRWVGMVLWLAVMPMALSAQDGISRKQQEKIQDQKAREDKKAKARKAKEDRKRHLAIQDKATRKRLKKHTKRADRSGTNNHR